jgi:hypothetical protein
MHTTSVSHDINPAVVRLMGDDHLVPLGTREPLEPGPYGAWVVPQHRRAVGSSAAPSQERRRGLTAVHRPHLRADVGGIPKPPINEASERIGKRAGSSRDVMALILLTSALRWPVPACPIWKESDPWLACDESGIP